VHITVRTSAYPRCYPWPSLLAGSLTTRHAVGTCSCRHMRGRVALLRSQLPWFASVGRCFPPGFCGSACRSVDSAAGALSCAVLAPACQPLMLGDSNDGSSHLRLRCPEMLARRDTRMKASRLRHLSPLQTLEDQSQTWGIRCHSCTRREGLTPSWKLSYKIDLLRSARGLGSSFDQRIARILMSYRMIIVM